MLHRDPHYERSRPVHLRQLREFVVPLGHSIHYLQGLGKPPLGVVDLSNVVLAYCKCHDFVQCVDALLRVGVPLEWQCSNILVAQAVVAFGCTAVGQYEDE